MKSIILSTLLITSCFTTAVSLPLHFSSAANDKHVPVEQPASLRNSPEQIIVHTGYRLSFNRETLCPNWVAWELTAQETQGSAQRSNDFRPDPAVPFRHQVTTEDYKHCGYDRGHMCPSADMKWSPVAQSECFFMSNICPQLHSLNAGGWEKLERACRRWAKREGKSTLSAVLSTMQEEKFYISANNRKSACLMLSSRWCFLSRKTKKKPLVFITPIEMVNKICQMQLKVSMKSNK